MPPSAVYPALADKKSFLDLHHQSGLSPELDYIYQDGEIEKKREVTDSMYPEKLTFDGEQLQQIFRHTGANGNKFSQRQGSALAVEKRNFM